MGQILDLIVVAEGVETTRQLAFLKPLNCSEAQGFLFSRPVSGVEITQMLTQKQVFLS
jgi:EAL domain-containing protein (putative c-di-GMP-specific phosphodiesterase class I)